ncbi:hypothetical protein SAMN02745216_04262 [Desulfatibacillum alkenivorans DSM 16219]|jgi:hypothetical protein|uniref:Uncharacterized protein n=1 Tax=Desulfatibacillum alkenivorans DSM 16219 TaxID=1121393 RepID=A0A1M6W761_9BACT|nr:hypothetical protein [Desulfatibacillum alkenivorans]SHK89335.1 hypothetical protein SAMN02745216_04262 [Desulfatibacillum alkenivorans DSM 16219]
MNYKISTIHVSIDEVHLSSDTKMRLDFSNSSLPGYKSLPLLPLTGKGKSYKYTHWKKTKESQTYEVCFRYQHFKTGNHLHLFKGRIEGARYLPTVALVFYSSFESPLSYEEVVFALNVLTAKLNCGWELSEFHVATDLYSADNYLKPLAESVVSRKSRGPRLIGDGTYHFHSSNSDVMLKAYDKSRQLLKEKRDTLCPATVEALKKTNITRFEIQLSTTGRGKENPDFPYDLPGLATHDFSFLVPEYFGFVEPDAVLLRRRGIMEDEYCYPSLSGFKEFLKQRSIKGHYTRFIRHSKGLNTPITEALRAYRWSKAPEKSPIIKPRPVFPENIRVEWK